MVGLGAHRLGIGHHLGHPFVAIVGLAWADGEVAEVGQEAAAGLAYELHYPGQPLAVRTEVSVVFDDAVDANRAADLGQLRQAIGGALLLLLKGSSLVSLRIDPDRMATQELGGLGPLAVVFDGLLALGSIRVSEGALAVAHDE